MYEILPQVSSKAVLKEKFCVSLIIPLRGLLLVSFTLIEKFIRRITFKKILSKEMSCRLVNLTEPKSCKGL